MAARFGIANGKWIIGDDGEASENLVDQSLQEDRRCKERIPLEAGHQLQAKGLQQACPEEHPKNGHEFGENISKKEQADGPNQQKAR